MYLSEELSDVHGTDQKGIVMKTIVIYYIGKVFHLSASLSHSIIRATVTSQRLSRTNTNNSVQETHKWVYLHVYVLCTCVSHVHT